MVISQSFANDVLLEDLKLDKSTFSKVMTLHNGVDSDLFSNSKNFGNLYNQIWSR